jgi:Class II Aldolase and Adducin N-terminal domain
MWSDDFLTLGRIGWSGHLKRLVCAEKFQVVWRPRTKKPIFKVHPRIADHNSPTMPPSISTIETTKDTPATHKRTHGSTSIITERPMDTLTMGNRAGTIHMPTIPSFTNPVDEREWALEHMAGAFRLFGKFHFGEGAAGHISLRDPVNPDWMWINPYGLHFSQIRKRDLVCVDEEGFVLGGVGAQKPVNTAGVHIHRELHRARPDIKAACHAHSIHGFFPLGRGS